MIGKSLSNFKIKARLGEGGMGEVWRAEDSKLGRDVALKILPAEFSVDPERIARFEREAKVLASMNHPNIATLFGLETLPPRTGKPETFSRHGARGGRRPFRPDRTWSDPRRRGAASRAADRPGA